MMKFYTELLKHWKMSAISNQICLFFWFFSAFFFVLTTQYWLFIYVICFAIFALYSNIHLDGF